MDLMQARPGRPRLSSLPCSGDSTNQGIQAPEWARPVKGGRGPRRAGEVARRPKRSVGLPRKSSRLIVEGLQLSWRAISRWPAPSPWRYARTARSLAPRCWKDIASGSEAATCRQASTSSFSPRSRCASLMVTLYEVQEPGLRYEGPASVAVQVGQVIDRHTEGKV